MEKRHDDGTLTKKFRMALAPTTISNRDFVDIGSTITKYTNTMERGLEEQAIGIEVPADEISDSENPSIDMIE